jgi:hypothetical protein
MQPREPATWGGLEHTEDLILTNYMAQSLPRKFLFTLMNEKSPLWNPKVLSTQKTQKFFTRP